MIVVTTRHGKQVEDSSEKTEEVKASEPTSPEKEVVEEKDKKETYVAPYKPPIMFLYRLSTAKIEAIFKKVCGVVEKNLHQYSFHRGSISNSFICKVVFTEITSNN